MFADFKDHVQVNSIHDKKYFGGLIDIDLSIYGGDGSYR